MKITKEVFEDVADKLQNLKVSSGYSTFKKWLENPDAYYTPVTVSVAWEGETPVGWSGVGQTRGRERYPVIGVFVDPILRGKGIGEKLVQTAAKIYMEETKADWGDMKPVILYDHQSWPKLRKIIDDLGAKAFDIDSVLTKGTRA